MPRLRGTLARVFWPRVHTGRVHTGRARTCSLNRRPRYALGREHAHVPVCTRGPKSSAIITAPGEKCGLAPTSRRRLVVHVGLPKTGSSTIQHALAALAPELRCQGVHVPVAGRSPRPDGSIRHANLLRALTGVDFKPEHGAWPELAEELRESNARQFVVSDEMLSRRPLEATRALADLADSVRPRRPRPGLRAASVPVLRGPLRAESQFGRATAAVRSLGGRGVRRQTRFPASLAQLPLGVRALAQCVRPARHRHPA